MLFFLIPSGGLEGKTNAQRRIPPPRQGGGTVWLQEAERPLERRSDIKFSITDRAGALEKRIRLGVWELRAVVPSRTTGA